jgi:CubicO group peptidase (beta-lactamase class C family)
MLQTQVWYRTVLEWPIEYAPDTDFAYSTGASSLMSLILNNITNKTPQQFIQESLYQPLDITDFHWELIEANGMIGQGISVFPSNLAPLGFGIWLKPIDMAKIGELIRTGGIWQEQRLLSEAWIDNFKTSNSDGVTDPDIFGRSNSGYSYQWWQQNFNDAQGRTFQCYYANGYGRQYIFIFPEANMVVISTANDYDSQTSSSQGIGALLRNYILPGILDGPPGH